MIVSVILMLHAITGLCVGFLLFVRPDAAIEGQRRFYELINWKIEPISMTKEVRNTRAMGLFLIVISFLTAIHAVTGGF